MVVASIQKAVREGNSARLVAAGPWDLLIVDECHHLSDWEAGRGSPNGGFRGTCSGASDRRSAGSCY